jgi:hypothetical protein
MSLNKNNNSYPIFGAIIFMAIFIVGLVIYSSYCNDKVGSPCQNIEVLCNLNNFSIYNKTETINTQNITLYYLHLICNYIPNNSCSIYDGKFYNYDTAYDYFNYYYNNTNTYEVYLLDNSSYCSFDIPIPDKSIVIIGLCIMVITTFIFATLALCYCITHSNRRKYVRISDKVINIENPPVYSPN